MRYFFLLLLFFAQFINASGYNIYIPIENHAQKTLTSENTDLNECSYKLFRYYDPQMGSYISQDPIRLAGNNPTLYAYVHDPNSWIDMFGLMPNWMKTKQGYQRHHIIPQSLKNHPIIEASGINIDGASNMKYLPVAEGIDPNPNKSIHNGWNDVHSDYNKTMNKRLNDLNSRAQLEGWDKRRMQTEITDLQRKTRAELDSGKLKCH